MRIEHIPRIAARTAAIATVLAVAPGAVRAASDISTREVVVSGANRKYAVYSPRLTGPEKRPVVIARHGSGGRGRDMVAAWKDIADKNGVVVAGPDAGNREFWKPPTDGPEFLRLIVADLDTSYQIDTRRIYLFGYSAGAVFALYMAPMEPEYFAAAAVHAGAYGGEAQLTFLDDANRKIPLFFTVGTKDDHFPQSVVLETIHRLEEAGFPTKLQLLPGRPHSYERPWEVNEAAWAFLREHRLETDPKYTQYEFGTQPKDKP